MDLMRNIDTSRIHFDFLENTSKDGMYDAQILSLGGSVYHSGYSRRKTYAAAKYMKDFFRNHDEYHIVHIHESYLPSFNMITMHYAKKYGKTVILHSRNAYGVHPVLHSMLKGIHSKKADYHFACSKKAAKWMFDDKTIEKGDYKIIKNAIPVDRFVFNPDVRKAERKKLGISDHDFVIGHIGRFFEQKNHKFLIEVFDSVARHIGDVRLILVGRGPLKEHIREQAEKMGLMSKIIFLDVTDTVERLYQAFDVFVLPSLFEGLPGVGVEAQAAGLPCVFSDNITDEVEIVPDLSERISLKHGTGIWREKITQIYEKQKKGVFQRRNTSAELRTAGFDVKEAAKEITDFYESVADGKDRGAGWR